jgi:tRNA threonylcarbamoyladenosine biosynthesis protein TsaB
MLFCGELTSASRQALHKEMQDKGFFISNIFATRQASTLATLAFQRLQEGKEDDPLLLEPLYLRRPSITRSVRKQPLFGVDARKAPSSSSNEEGRREGIAPSQSAEQEKIEREQGALRH